MSRVKLPQLRLCRRPPGNGGEPIFLEAGNDKLINAGLNLRVTVVARSPRPGQQHFKLNHLFKQFLVLRCRNVAAWMRSRPARQFPVEISTRDRAVSNLRQHYGFPASIAD